MPDTIAAIATPQIPSAIGILRLSGPDTFPILERVFRPVGAVAPRKMVYGTLLSAEGEPLDQVLCVRFPAPRSYTGEDCAEIHCHGSPVVLNEGLLSLFAAGARQAGGGEFTQRAFLSGQMDLMQAESVIDLIDAETAEAARNALGQLNGTLSRSVDSVYEALLGVVSRFYAVVDYPDEDIEDLQRQELADTLGRCEGTLSALLDTFRRGAILKTGIPTVILGKPNAGKSSLLNALLGYDRAIVTNVAGTTRDTVEEKVRVGRVLLRLIDTAGIRSTEDEVEAIGVERTRKAAERAELCILVLDGSVPLSDEDAEAMAIAKAAPHTITVINKRDLPTVTDVDGIFVSTVTGEGVDVLCERIEKIFRTGVSARGELLTNARQRDAVARALEAIRSAKAALESGLTADAVLTDGEAAMAALGELNGKQIREDLVATIFSRFCVGK